jgi:hypothetical protein
MQTSYLVKSTKKQPAMMENACGWRVFARVNSGKPQRHFTALRDHW